MAWNGGGGGGGGGAWSNSGSPPAQTGPYELIACCGTGRRRVLSDQDSGGFFGNSGGGGQTGNNFFGGGSSPSNDWRGQSSSSCSWGSLKLLGGALAVLLAGSLAVVVVRRAMMSNEGPQGDEGSDSVSSFTPHEGNSRSSGVLGGASDKLDPAMTGPADGPPSITFYMYRATGDVHYPLQNVNTADLSGVMWYLHNEIVVAPHRKYGIDRIKRFKMTMRPPVEFWNVHHSNFAPFMAFDAAQCTGNDCEKIYGKYGFVAGCQPVTPGRSAYQSEVDSLIQARCKDDKDGCRQPMWYSFPGPCPLKKLKKEQVDGHLNSRLSAKSEDEAKSDECIASQPGGLCDKATGAPDCVYDAEEAGEILLDDLTGIGDYESWFTKWEETQEYNQDTDKGKKCSFWDDRHDKQKCAKRLQKALDLFQERHGTDPNVLPLPKCDFMSFFDGEFDWPLNHTGGVPPVNGFKWKDGFVGTVV